MSNSGSEHWSSYWESGQLTSLPGDFSANYAGEIKRFWAEQFSRVPSGGAILDVCTGNGAIALLAAGWSLLNTARFNVQAVDAAQIDPERLGHLHKGQRTALKEITFHPSTPLEQFQLADQGFDLVTSQYGIEYCEWQAAAQRVFELLKPGGRFALVTHASDSSIMRYMKMERAEYDVLDSTGFIRVATGYLQGQISFSALHGKVDQAGQLVFAEFRKSQSPFFKYVLDNLQSLIKLDEAALNANRKGLQTFCRQLQHGRQRIADMLRVNEAIGADSNWIKVFLEAGLNLEDNGELMVEQKHHSGRWYCFTRPELKDSPHG